ncbi:hypothetical protein S7711_10423 [Stachybotrys chartarum IBT 7711]|uniref:Uncharacterized protein n=1 Tax=Stachybotrys chartarum (strain CBS 109288 / IBT 7711) TaxID=1280523 RepID=A0A084B4G9_STACB|nr:hypothetical protein S7711_10423 [Stachybotrys chartarum IBT 7711]
MVGDTNSLVDNKAEGLALLSRLVDLGLDPDQVYRNTTPLQLAAAAANQQAVEFLIQRGARVDGHPDAEETPLVAACRYEYSMPILGVVSTLLEAGASPNQTRKSGLSPALLLSTNGGMRAEEGAVLDCLIEHGARVSRGTSGGDISNTTPLEAFLREIKRSKFEELMCRCNPDLGEDDIIAFWHSVCDAELCRRILELDRTGVVARRESRVLFDLMDEDPIDSELVGTLLRQGLDLKSMAPDDSVLVYGVEHGIELEDFKAFLSHGADPNGTGNGRSVMAAVICDDLQLADVRLECVRLLLDAGVSVHQETRQWVSKPFIGYEHMSFNTHLSLAFARSSNNGIVNLMLERQPPREDSQVPLYYYIFRACISGNLKALKALIQSSDAALLAIQANINELVHALLDHLGVLHQDDNIRCEMDTLGDLSKVTDCLQFIMENKMLDLTVEAPGGSLDKRTAREKFLAIAATPRKMSGQPRTLRRTFLEQRIRFMEEDTMPTFSYPNLDEFDWYHDRS